MIVYYEQTDSDITAAVTEGGRLERVFHFDKNMYTDSVYRGKVKFVKKSVGIFVDLGLDRDGFLPYREGLKAGDGITVRVTTEPKEERGVLLSENLDLPGRTVVLLHRDKNRFSKKLSSERKKELELLPISSPYGFLFRTECEDCPNETILAEIKELTRRLDDLSLRASCTAQIECLYQRNPLQAVFDLGGQTVEGLFPIRNQLAALAERKITTEDGVELVFDKAEAMTVVDVNFHTFTERGDRSCFSADKIAVVEFARQLRLRNIGGLIALDYISLENEEDKEELFSLLKKELRKDYFPCQAEHASGAGVFIVTRKKMYK